jgi:1,4-alpha-glucan branching enzyme
MKVAIFCAMIAWLGCGSAMYEWRGRDELNVGPKAVEGGVMFSIYEPKADRVHVVGDFNNWSTTADPLYNREGDGLWAITIPLSAGRYEYKFLIDSEKWVPDPGNPEWVDDGFDGKNSVLIVE